ncbi:mutator type transposase [Tanacetum coccineum]
MNSHLKQKISTKSTCGGESIPMVNNGKLSRRAKTMTCVLCKSKGHNKRSCKGPTANAGKKRTKAETFVGTSDIDKKAKKNDGGINTRSFKTTKKGKQATATDKAKKNAKKGKKAKCRLKFFIVMLFDVLFIALNN